jgi:hypothetical protein
MLLSPSIYSPNKFAKFFSQSVRFLGPDSLNEVWTMDITTGQYEFSDLFNSRFQDIHSWALSIDFFIHFPQLIGVIPIYNAMPRSLDFPMSLDQMYGTSKIGEVSEDVMLWNVDLTSCAGT